MRRTKLFLAMLLALLSVVPAPVPVGAQSCSAGYSLISGALLTSGGFPFIYSNTAAGMSSYVGTSTVSVNVYSASNVFIGTATVTTPLVLVAPASIKLNRTTGQTTTVVWCSLNPATATPTATAIPPTPTAIPPTATPTPYPTVIPLAAGSVADLGTGMGVVMGSATALSVKPVGIGILALAFFGLVFELLRVFLVKRSNR